LPDGQDRVADLAGVDLRGQSRVLPLKEQRSRVGAGSRPVVLVAFPARFTPVGERPQIDGPRRGQQFVPVTGIAVPF